MYMGRFMKRIKGESRLRTFFRTALARPVSRRASSSATGGDMVFGEAGVEDRVVDVGDLLEIGQGLQLHLGDLVDFALFQQAGVLLVLDFFADGFHDLVDVDLG